MSECVKSEDAGRLFGGECGGTDFNLYASCECAIIYDENVRIGKQPSASHRRTENNASPLVRLRRLGKHVRTSRTRKKAGLKRREQPLLSSPLKNHTFYVNKDAPYSNFSRTAAKLYYVLVSPCTTLHVSHVARLYSLVSVDDEAERRKLAGAVAYHSLLQLIEPVLPSCDKTQTRGC